MKQRASALPRRVAAVLLFFLVLASLMQDALAEAGSDAFFLSPLARYERGVAPNEEPGDRWEVEAWRSERVHTQLLVRTASAGDNVGVRPSALRNGTAVIPASAISVREIGYARGDRSAGNCETDLREERHSHTVLLPDPIYDDVTADIRAEHLRLFWVTIEVPRVVDPGQYIADIIVTSREGTSLMRLQVSLLILDLQLPDAAHGRFHLDLWQHPTAVLSSYRIRHPGKDVRPWSIEHLELLTPHFQRLFAIGQSTLTTYIKDGALGGPSMVAWKLGSDGATWRFDFADFDRYVSSMSALGFEGQISAFSLFGWSRARVLFTDERTGLDGWLDGQSNPELFNAAWSAFLASFREHLVDRGWFDRTVLYFDEPSPDEVEIALALISADSEEWKVGLAYSRPEHLEKLNAYYDASGIFEIAQTAKPRDSYLRTFYTSCTQEHPNIYLAGETELAEIPWLVWHAVAAGYDGFLRWAFDRWPDDPRVDAAPVGFTAGDAYLTYLAPEQSSFVSLSSIRLELLGDAIEDAEKVIYLREQDDLSGHGCSRQKLGELLSGFSRESGQTGKVRTLVESAQSRLAEVSRDFAFRCMESATASQNGGSPSPTR